MADETNDIRLIVEIKNGKPLELIDLTKSLVSLGSQFNSYVQSNGDSKENREAKLYVKEIKTGSVILDLVEHVSRGAIPFVENSNTIVGFALHLKQVVQFFSKNIGQKPDLKENDYKELNAVINPIASDSASQLNISTTINGNVQLYVNLNSLEANALQNIFKGEINEGKKPQLGDSYEKVLFYWNQTKADIKADSGNKGVIESISPKPMNVTFDNDQIKNTMLHSENQNPLMYASIIDIKAETIKGQIALYKILKVHESFLREE